MRDNLVGYLLGALDADEHQQVERQLKVDQQLAADLESLRSSLHLLEHDREDHAPPAGLAARTMAGITSQANHSIRSQSPRATADARATPEVSPPPKNRHSFADIAVAGGITLALAMLFFPAIANSRYQAELTACKRNLSELGAALSGFSKANDGNFPAVHLVNDSQAARGGQASDAAGKFDSELAAAGMYAPQLVEAGHVDDPQVFVCPASPKSDCEEPFHVPSLDELRRMSRARFAAIKRRLGGDYGYNLGYIEGDRLRPVRYQGRGTFAIMADRPLDSPRPCGSRSSAHHGSLQNVLFEDGHVGTLRGCRDARGDDIFVSVRGLVEAGRHRDDAVIAPSEAGPFWHK